MQPPVKIFKTIPPSGVDASQLSSANLKVILSRDILKFIKIRVTERGILLDEINHFQCVDVVYRLL